MCSWKASGRSIHCAWNSRCERCFSDGGPGETNDGEFAQQAVSSEAQPARSTSWSKDVVLEFQRIPYKGAGNEMVR